MSTIDPHPLDTPGYIVAWRDKQAFEAGKMLDDVMTFGEATRKAEELSKKSDNRFYWAEQLPQKFEPH
ncbi:MAG: hypothetical protein RQ736_04360 [Thiogranum sp.]|nr:hypothetical protein [Thiogranum sp.]